MTPHDHSVRYGAKRERILAAAAQLINAQGVRGTTLTQVAERVGLGTTSITYYFRRKDDLAQAAFLQTIQTIDGLIDQTDGSIGAPQRDPATWLRAYMDLYFQALAAIDTGTRPEFTTFSDVRTLTGSHRTQVFDAYVGLFRKVRRLFAGLPLSRASRNARTHLLFAIHLWVPAWLRRHDPADFRDAARRMCDVLLEGLDPGLSAWPSSAIDRDGLTDEGDENAFLAAATAILNEQGYSGASIDRIAARLGVTKGAFYHRNDGKHDLVVACQERALRTVRRIQDQARAAHVLGWDRLVSTCVALVELEVERPGSILRTTALAALSTGSRRDSQIRTDRLSTRYGVLVAEGIIDGSIRPVDPGIAGRLVESMINAAVELTDWTPGITASQASILYVRPLFRGLLSLDDDPAA